MTDASIETAYLAPEGFLEELLVEVGEDVAAVHGRLVLAAGSPRPLAWVANIWEAPQRIPIASIGEDDRKRLRAHIGVEGPIVAFAGELEPHKNVPRLVVGCHALEIVEEQGVRFVRLWFTDVLGFLKSFAIPAPELEKAFEEGIGFDGSAVEGFARVEEADMLAKPDPSTFKLLPWRRDSEPVARVVCDVLHPDGSPFEGDPRGVC